VRRVAVLFFVAALLVPTGLGVAAADVEGSPNLSVTLTDDAVAPGEDTQLRFTLSNAGRVREGGNPQSESRVTTARDVRVTVEDGDAPLSVETGTVAVGSLPDGASAPVGALVHVDEDADPGDYEVRVTVEYVHTARISSGRNGSRQTDRTVERTFEVDLTVEETPRFAVVAARSSAAVGDPGTVTLTVRNRGPVTARAATLTARSGDAGLTFGEGPSASAALGDVDPDENRTVAFSASVAPSATARAFPVETTVAYEDADGVPARDTDTARVGIGAEQTFAVVRAETDAGVGGRGELALAVRNTGRDLTDASLTVRSDNAALAFDGGPTTETFVGDWATGEVKRLSLTASVAPGAARRSYALAVTPSYTNAAGESVRGESLSMGVVPAAEQSFNVVFRRGTVPVGGSGEVTLAVRNTGRDVDDASLSIRSSNAALSFGGSPTADAFVGDWAAGETERVTVEATVAPGAARRSYALAVTPSYTDAAGERAQGAVLTTGVTPAAEQTFAVVDREVRVPVGGSGNVTLTVRNTAQRDLTDASVTIRSSNAALSFGGAPTATTFVGDWAAGETEQVTVTATVAPDAERRRYALDATVSYTTPTDRDGRTALSTGITPRPQRSFSVVDGDVDVRVGAEGNLTGTLVNDGPGPVENAVLVLEPPGRTIDAGESEVALGDLAAGERAEFSFELDASEEATAGPRQFTLRLRYDDADGSGTDLRSDPLYVRGAVGPARAVFSVSTVEGSFDAGAGGELVLRVTNTGDRTVSDVSAKLFADDPLSTSDDEAYVQRLASGESTNVTFGLSVGGGALAKAYPVSVDFQYDEPDGDTKLSDTYRAPVTVREGGDGGALPSLPALLAIGVIALLVVVVAVALRRRP